MVGDGRERVGFEFNITVYTDFQGNYVNCIYRTFASLISN